MYTKEELKAHKTAFWTAFKSRMAKHRSVNGRKMNWLNYPSDVSYIHIRLDADHQGARFCFDIQAKDAGVRAIIWEQLQELKIVIESEMGTDGQWLQHHSTPVIPQFDRIQWELPGVSIFHREDTESIFDFFEDRLLHFDAFYQEFKDILVNLAS